jgi:ribosomal protein S18 acetylase RimI-like enzyme
MVMELDEPEEALRKKIRRRFRDYISSAPTRGISVRPSAPEERGREFHSALAAAGRRKGLPVRGRRHFESLWKEYLRDDQGVLLIAQHNGTVVGGLLGTRLGKTAYMLYVTQRDRPDGDPLHQGPVLYWEFVRWAKSRGCERIDWGGVGTHYPPREDDPGYGVYLFKRGFNSQLCYMTGYYDRIFSKRLYLAFRSLERSSSAVAWTARAKLNDAVLLFDDVVDSGGRKLRQFKVSVSHRGLWTTVYWAAFGFLKPNRFVVFSRSLSRAAPQPAEKELALELWPSARLKEWRRHRSGLSTEFFQNEIDGVENCVVAREGDEIAGLIWIYYPGDKSRLFQLRDGEAELNQGYVLPRYRGRGVFRKVIAFACDTLAKQGYRTAYAMVHSSNVPSLKAFEGAGFHRQGRVRHFLAWRPRFRTARHADASSVS